MCIRDRGMEFMTLDVVYDYFASSFATEVFNVGTVSYTHLDVYKRQPLVLRKRIV